MNAAELTPGHYICVRSRSPLGWLVRVFCHAPWSHAMLVTAPGYVIEATATGIREGPLSRYAGCKAVANVGEPMNSRQAVTAVRAARSFAKDEYGFSILLLIAFRLAGIRWKWLQILASDKDAIICSELVAEAGHAAGLDWLAGKTEAALVKPSDLAKRPGMQPVVI